MNLGAQKLRAAAGAATIADIATELGIDRTYCGRLLADDRTPGLALRQKARDRYGVGIEDWDQQLPDIEQHAQPSKPTGTGI